jgi:hypothetical protein
MFIGSLKNRWRSNKCEFMRVLAPAILISSILFFFGPFTIYSGNVSEFQLSLVDILKYCAIPGIGIVALFLIIGLLLSKRFLLLYVSLLLVSAVLLWIQGNFLVWNYGLFDGQGISYQYFDWRAFDILLWITLLGISVFWAKKLAGFSIIICTALLFVQITYACFIVYTNPDSMKSKEAYSYKIPNEILQFSNKRNIIHIILDAFQSDLFESIIETDFRYFSTKLNRFTFFRDTLGSFPTTYMSLPAIFSGINYKNHIPMPTFFMTTFKNTFLNVLAANGYDRESVSTDMTCFDKSYEVPKPYNRDKFQVGIAETLRILDFSLFRFVPHIGKGVLYNDEKWSFQKLYSRSGLIYTPVNHAKFFEEYINLIEVAPKKPTYKFIHLFTTHAPLVLDANCEYLGEPISPKEQYNDQYLLPQLTCGLRQVTMLFDRFKDMGIYDNSMIILQADHGYGKPITIEECHEKAMENNHLSGHIIGCALPLLAIKRFNSNEGFKISNAQVSLTDIPATIMGELGIRHNFPGKSVFELDDKEQRDRRFLYYVWRHEAWQGDYFDKLYEFAISGAVLDQSSWRHVATYYPPENDSRRMKIFDQKISFVGFGEKRELPNGCLSARAGENLLLALFVKNPSNETWFANGVGEDACGRVRLGCYWLDSRGKRHALERGCPLPNDLGPNEFITLEVSMPIPRVPGEYSLRCSMVQECIAWFDSRGGELLEIPVKAE